MWTPLVRGNGQLEYIASGSLEAVCKDKKYWKAMTRDLSSGFSSRFLLSHRTKPQCLARKPGRVSTLQRQAALSLVSPER